MPAPRDRTLVAEIERNLLDGQPIADVLRKLIILGGRSGSADLRDWASDELRGYTDTSVDDLPDYRRVGAVIKVDAIIGPNQVTGQTLAPYQFPEEVREHITNDVPFFQGIGEIEAMARQEKGTHIKLGLPGERYIASLLDRESGNPYQHITQIYWSVAVAAIDGLVDQVRTRLAEFLGELRASTPPGAEPSLESVDSALTVVVTGKRNHVQVAQAADQGHSSVEAAKDDDSPFWTLSRRIWATVLGLATLFGTTLTVLQFMA